MFYLATLLDGVCSPRSLIRLFGQGSPRCGYLNGFRMGSRDVGGTIIEGTRGALLGSDPGVSPRRSEDGAALLFLKHCKI